MIDVTSVPAMPSPPGAGALFLAAVSTADAELPSLREQVALITGCSRGLGAAIAQVLGESGMRVVLADRDFQRAQDSAAVLSERDIQVMPLALDLGHSGQCAEAVDLVVQRFGRLDALVINTAPEVSGSPSGTGMDGGVLDTQLSGTLALSRAASAHMRKRGGGHIFNIAATEPTMVPTTRWSLLGLSHVRVNAPVSGGAKSALTPGGFPGFADARPQDPLHVAQAVRYVLQQPEGHTSPSLTDQPTLESDWP
ncbi:NADP-dependent 3-hydroxy acid dehydrogenase YdfG [Roseateles sp. YR242]|uniref:SDR family oxidoreductase n=1 Tax=Roseateles sp. YR242 TaxID=1855305 RepID=UPI0008C8CA4E|nr:SDR family oxidoreductase [Roseateles sp. YR242]SEL19204.1 NADP-dependent 3-hydroxy acid dehydrogenase YdfG [Roseateles sp. YR242]